METIKNYIEQQPGAKIASSHFRLGSKIHISDFFYAKRLFQNSYFASRFAFIIARFIDNNYSNQAEITKRLTIIGYGQYSELLLSLIENYLKIIWKIKSNNRYISHNLISDSEDLNLVKGYEKPKKNIIIIVPIATTFSTSIKIEEKLKANFPESNVLTPHINVLLISHGDIKDYPEKEGIVQIPKIASFFGWNNINRKENIIDIVSFKTAKNAYKSDESSDTILTTQKYFLSLPTEWRLIENCKDCFPEKGVYNECCLSECNTCDLHPNKSFCPLNEKPLFNTDKTSVTPSLIFGIPKGRYINETTSWQKFFINPQIIKFPHWVRDGNHYNYYILIEDFFELNKTLIIEWLTGVVKQKLKFSDTDYIILVAPGHYTNTSFLNLVNEILFSNSANIIHYDSKKDYIQNFRIFYQKELQEADMVIFVDDVITSGSTFITSNRFVYQTRNNRDRDYKNIFSGFDASIVLLDRSSHYVHENIINKISKLKDSEELAYFSFANLHLPILRDLDGKFTLCNEEERYQDLFNNSFLDRLKVHFLIQKLKISPKYSDEKNETYSESNCRKIEAIHRINQWFTLNRSNIDDYNSIEDWEKDLEQNSDSPFLTNYFTSSSKQEVLDTLFKVLTQYPFIQYKPLREITFKWVLFRLFVLVKKVFSEIESNKLSEVTFRDLKFIIRRAGLLKSNYLMSNIFFELLQLLYGENGILDLKIRILKEKEKCNNQLNGTIEFKDLNYYDDSLANINDFNVFFAAQIKELLIENEAKSIHLEKLIIEYKEHEITPNFRQLLRILQEENGLLIQKFWLFLKNNSTWINQIKFKNFNLTNIKEQLQIPSISNHHLYTDLNNFFINGNQLPLIENREFQRYCLLMSYLFKENGEVDPLNIKTEYICESLKEIIVGNTDSNNGSFLIVKYLRNGPRYFNAYNKGSSRTDIDKSLSKESSFLIQFLNGIIDNTDHSFISIIEFHKEKNGWKNLYATVNSSEVADKIELDLLNNESNRLILLRLNKRNYNSDKRELEDIPQGIFGIYYYQNNEKITPSEKIRYLLLLRHSLSNFVQDHHENNEFRDWIEADNRKRTGLLTGHGREMLIDLALKHQYPYSEIVSTILLVQRLVLDYEDLDSIGCSKERVKDVFKKLFKKENDIIDNNFLSRLKEMAIALFNFEEIENSICCKVSITDCVNNLEYPFSKEILQMIFFEIIVNAKKNCWIFINNEKFICEGVEILENQIYINSALNGENLEITISNTGPYVDCIAELNKNKNVKSHKSASGIELIDTILNTFEIGNISFDQKIINSDFCLFIVHLTLNKML